MAPENISKLLNFSNPRFYVRVRGLKIYDGFHPGGVIRRSYPFSEQGCFHCSVCKVRGANRLTDLGVKESLLKLADCKN